jgi:hypothetical protein
MDEGLTERLRKAVAEKKEMKEEERGCVERWEEAEAERQKGKKAEY